MFWKSITCMALAANIPASLLNVMKIKHQTQTNLFSKATISNSALSPEWGGRAQPWVRGEHQCGAGDCSAEQRRRDLLMSPASIHNSDLLFRVFTFESKLYFLLWQIHAHLKYHESFGTVLCQKMPKVTDLLKKNPPHTLVEMTLFLLYFLKKQRQFTIVFIFVKSCLSQICTAGLTHNPSPPYFSLVSPTWLPICCSTSAPLASGAILKDRNTPKTCHRQHTITVCKLHLHQFISQLRDRAPLCDESVSWVLSSIFSYLYFSPSTLSSKLFPIFKEINILLKIFLLLEVLDPISADDHRLPSSCWQGFYNWHMPDLPKFLGSKPTSVSP